MTAGRLCQKAELKAEPKGPGCVVAVHQIRASSATGFSAQYIGTDTASQRAGLKSELTYYILTIGIATFVLLRSAWIARLVLRFSKRDNNAS